MTGSRSATMRMLRRLALGGCVMVSAYGYISGWPAWLLVVILLLIPFLSFSVWMFTGRLRRYRFLFGIYLVAGFVGSYEAWQYQRIPESLTSSLDMNSGPGEPDLFLEHDLPSVLYELYPERSEVLFIRAFQMKLCQEDRRAWQQNSVCEQFHDTDLSTIREYFERALRNKSKTDENLYFHYVEILMRLDAPQSEIDAAAREWKRLFPLSERPDPRTAFANLRPDKTSAERVEQRN
ncbi:MAG: hypothetical protein RIK87_04535 [Fuerstiella sp.]